MIKFEQTPNLGASSGFAVGAMDSFLVSGVLLGKVVVYVFRWMENLLSSPITLFSTGWGEDFLGKRFSILQFRRKFLSLCRFNLFHIKGLREYQVLTVCMCKEVMKSVDHLFPPSGLGSVFYLSLSAWQAVILQKTCYWLVLVIFVYVPSCGVS